MKKIIKISTILAGIIISSNAVASNTPKTLNIGILGGESATQQIGDNMCVKNFLDKELNVDTKLRNSSDYAGVIQGQLGGTIDLVLNGSASAFASVYTQDPNAVELVAIPQDDTDNSKGYYSVVVVKSDSPYKTLKDLKGKAFGFADPDSTSGYLVPQYQFSQMFGGNMDNKFNNTFSSVTFSGGHEQDLVGVLNGQFDGAVTWSSLVGDRSKGYTSGEFTEFVSAGHPDLMKKIRVIWKSDLIPNGPITIRKNLPEDFKKKVIAALHKLDKEDHPCMEKALGGQLHLANTSLKDYQAIINLRKTLNDNNRS